MRGSARILMMPRSKVRIHDIILIGGIYMKRRTGALLAAGLLLVTGCSAGNGGGAATAEATAAETTATETAAAETITEAESTAAGTTTEDSAAAKTTAEGSAAAEKAEKSANTETTASADTEEVTYPYDFNSEEFLQIGNYWDYAPTAPISGVKEDGSYFRLKRENGFSTLQGSCTDGTYLYMLMQNAKAKFENDAFVSMCVLYKIDLSTWEIVTKSEPLPVDHGNSITYNSKTNELLVANASPNNHLISKIDPETLTVTDVIQYGTKLSGISYNALRDQYVIRLTGTHDFAILDADLVLQAEYKGGDTGLILQNIDSDDDYIYITDTSQTQEPGIEGMLVYDWNGNYAGAFRIDSQLENEGMFHVGDDYYMTFNNSGGRVYKIDIDRSLLNEPR